MNSLTPEVQRVAHKLYAGLDCPRSLSLDIMLRHGELKQMLETTCLPTSYNDADSYFRAACATDFLRKLEFDVAGVDPRKAASTKWLESEKACFVTNRRLNELADFGTEFGVPCSVDPMKFFLGLRKNVRSLIGNCPPQIFEGRFGPGATVSDRACRTTVLHKLSSVPTFTHSAAFYLVPFFGTKWGTAVANRQSVLRSVRGNEYFSVPKTALTHRPCAKEPSVNGFYQLGIGRVIRRRLYDSGIDLENGQELHRRLAQQASRDESFCTIDLSSASDTMSTALVRLALPPAWHDVLDDLRSSYTKKDGRWYRLEKFSSMGNGFTFELETTLFLAIAMTSCNLRPGKDLFVYGDDIIVPSHMGEAVIAALKFCGFSTNASKTFLRGPFRESCGGDFWDGVAVRPFCLKESPHEPQDFIVLANGIRRMEGQAARCCQSPSHFRSAWHATLDYIPRSISCLRGPPDLGDIVIHDDEYNWRVRWRNSIRYIRAYKPVISDCVRLDRFGSDELLAGALYGITPVRIPGSPKPSDTYDGRGLPLRGAVTGCKPGWVPYS